MFPTTRSRPASPRPLRRVGIAAATLAGIAVCASVLVGCLPEASPVPEAASTASPSAGASSTSTPTAATASGTPSPTFTPIALPTECASLLTANVASELAGVPLNDPDTGVATGVQTDGSLVCLWRDPRADTTFLLTKIAAMNRGPALELMNDLADNDGFTCYTPNGGTRCEKVWINETYPVNDGRTLFWRDDVLIDTTYSNLAPTGFTDSVVEAVFG